MASQNNVNFQQGVNEADQMNTVTVRTSGHTINTLKSLFPGNCLRNNVQLFLQPLSHSLCGGFFFLLSKVDMFHNTLSGSVAKSTKSLSGRRDFNFHEKDTVCCDYNFSSIILLNN